MEHAPGPSEWGLDPAGGAEALRVSFNSAEADLNFGNLSSELFSISDDFQEFLASHALPSNGSSAGPSSSAASVSASAALAAQLQAVSGTTGIAPLRQPPSFPVTKRSASFSLQHPSASGSSLPSASADMIGYFPMFSSLDLPMPLTSRAPSPLHEHSRHA